LKQNWSLSVIFGTIDELCSVAEWHGALVKFSGSAKAFSSERKVSSFWPRLTYDKLNDRLTGLGKRLQNWTLTLDGQPIDPLVLKQSAYIKYLLRGGTWTFRGGFQPCDS
jgi:hypothetical protein